MISLGIDTSNYTCSVALYDTEGGSMLMQKQLLKTNEGSIGLRQSEAVFEHIKLIGNLLQKLFSNTQKKPQVIGVSTRPRNAQGSYMPCFLVGETIAKSIASSNGIEALKFSHQEGHLAAALYSSNKLDWMDNKKFIAFHVSGGTTDCLLVQTKDGCFESVEDIGHSLDLKAGQVIDRVGVKMGLDFPAGPELEKLANDFSQNSNEKIKTNVCLKDTNCCLSGLENICDRLLKENKSKEYVANYCLVFIRDTIEGMLSCAFKKYGNMPVLFAGGVMSNKFLREYFQGNYNCEFAKPSYSSDNAGGAAVLAAKGGL